MKARERVAGHTINDVADRARKKDFIRTRRAKRETCASSPGRCAQLLEEGGVLISVRRHALRALKAADRFARIGPDDAIRTLSVVAKASQALLQFDFLVPR